jgi:hypothetical protein
MILDKDLGEAPVFFFDKVVTRPTLPLRRGMVAEHLLAHKAKVMAKSVDVVDAHSPAHAVDSI